MRRAAGRARASHCFNQPDLPGAALGIRMCVNLAVALMSKQAGSGCLLRLLRGRFPPKRTPQHCHGACGHVYIAVEQEAFHQQVVEPGCVARRLQGVIDDRASA